MQLFEHGFTQQNLENFFALSTEFPRNSSLVYWIILGAVVLAVPHVTWSIFGRFVTVFHELGHAVTGIMLGRRVKKIMILPDMSGETYSKGNRGFPLIWSTWWGYPFPCLYGLAFIWASYNGWSTRMLAITVIVLVLMLLFIRNIHGAGIIFILLAALIACLLLLNTIYIAYASLILGIALIIGSWRALVNCTRVHYGNDKTSSDAYFLTELTYLPSWFWFLTYYIMFIYTTALAVNVMSNGLVVSTVQRLLVSL